MPLHLNIGTESAYSAYLLRHFGPRVIVVGKQSALHILQSIEYHFFTLVEQGKVRLRSRISSPYLRCFVGLRKRAGGDRNLTEFDGSDTYCAESTVIHTETDFGGYSSERKIDIYIGPHRCAAGASAHYHIPVNLEIRPVYAPGEQFRLIGKEQFFTPVGHRPYRIIHGRLQFHCNTPGIAVLEAARHQYSLPVKNKQVQVPDQVFVRSILRLGSSFDT